MDVQHYTTPNNEESVKDCFKSVQWFKISIGLESVTVTTECSLNVAMLEASDTYIVDMYLASTNLNL